MKMPFRDLNDRVIVITGGSSGIGAAVALEAAQRNATVVICARRKDLLERIRIECEQLSGRPAYGFELDLADPEMVDEVFEKIVGTVGRIDVLVNSAGFGIFQPFLDVDMELAEKMFRVNVLGTMYFTQRAALHMSTFGEGHIITLASQAGKTATPKSTIYSATKFAVIGFCNALRLELKPLGISVTTVNPGPVRTPFFDNNSSAQAYLESIDWLALQPQEVARKIVNLMGSDRRELNVPFILELSSIAYQLFPRIGDYLAGTIFAKK